MICPYTAARLHELAWIELMTVRQITLLARAATGDDVSESDVAGWFAAAGVSPYVPPVVTTPPRQPRTTPPRRHRVPEERPCCYCGATVRRKPHRFAGRTTWYCGHACRTAARLADNADRREQLRREADFKRCPTCGIEKGSELFSVDQSRADGRARCCLACNAEKSKLYYERNRARLQEKNREHKRAERRRENE